MSIKLKNTTNELIIINDVGLNILPNGYHEIITKEDKYSLTESNDLLNLIINGNIIVNNVEDLLPNEGIRELLTDAILTGPKDRSGKFVFSKHHVN